LLRKLCETGNTSRRPGSGRPKRARTEENVTAVEELVVSQEDKPQTRRSTRQISRETGVAQSSVVQIIHRDLLLKCFKRRRAQELTEANHHAKLVRSKLLLKKYSPSDVIFIWFTDECSQWPHLRTRRMTACMLLQQAERKRSQLNAFFARD